MRTANRRDLIDRLGRALVRAIHRAAGDERPLSLYFIAWRPNRQDEKERWYFSRNFIHAFRTLADARKKFSRLRRQYSERCVVRICRMRTMVTEGQLKRFAEMADKSRSLVGWDANAMGITIYLDGTTPQGKSRAIGRLDVDFVLPCVKDVAWHSLRAMTKPEGAP